MSSSQLYGPCTQCGAPFALRCADCCRSAKPDYDGLCKTCIALSYEDGSYEEGNLSTCSTPGCERVTCQGCHYFCGGVPLGCDGTFCQVCAPDDDCYDCPEDFGGCGECCKMCYFSSVGPANGKKLIGTNMFTGKKEQFQLCRSCEKSRVKSRKDKVTATGAWVRAAAAMKEDGMPEDVVEDFREEFLAGYRDERAERRVMAEMGMVGKIENWNPSCSTASPCCEVHCGPCAAGRGTDPL